MRTKTLTVQGFNRARRALLRNLHSGRVDAYLVTRNGKKHMVVMSSERYRSWMRRIELQNVIEELWERLVQREMARLESEENDRDS